MKIYQKAKDKNVGANIVYVARVGEFYHVFATVEDAAEPIVEGETLVNALSASELEERFMAGNMMLCQNNDGSLEFEVALGFIPDDGNVYSSNIDAFGKEAYREVR